MLFVPVNRLREILNNNGTSIATRISSRWGLITELAGYGQCYDYIEYLAEYAPCKQRTMKICPEPVSCTTWGPF